MADYFQFFEKLARLGSIVFLPVGKGGKYLLQRDSSGLRPPGGGAEPEDEDLEATIRRETMEEFGLNAGKKLKLLGYEKRRKFRGNGVFRLEGHGLKPGIYQASNDPDEVVELEIAGLDHPDYVGPNPEKLRQPPLLKSASEAPIHGPVKFEDCGHINRCRCSGPHAPLRTEPGKCFGCRTKDEKLQKQAYVGDAPGQPALQPSFVGEDPHMTNPPGSVETGTPTDPAEQMAKKKVVSPGRFVTEDELRELGENYRQDALDPQGYVKVAGSELSEFELCSDNEVTEFLTEDWSKSASELEPLAGKLLPKYFNLILERLKAGKPTDYLFRGNHGGDAIRSSIGSWMADAGSPIKEPMSPFYSEGVTHASPFPQLAHSYGFKIWPDDGKKIGLKISENHKPSVLGIYRNSPQQRYFRDYETRAAWFKSHGIDEGAEWINHPSFDLIKKPFEEQGLPVEEALKRYGVKGMHETSVTPDKNKFLGWGLYHPHTKDIKILGSEQMARIRHLQGFEKHSNQTTELNSPISPEPGYDHILSHQQEDDLPRGSHVWRDGKLHPMIVDGITVHPDGYPNVQDMVDNLEARQRDLGQVEVLEKAAGTPTSTWHIVWPNGRALKLHELWPRPEDAIAHNGDLFTPWYNTFEHYHGVGHPFEGSFHIKAPDVAAALERCKYLIPGVIKEGSMREPTPEYIASVEAELRGVCDERGMGQAETEQEVRMLHQDFADKRVKFLVGYVHTNNGTTMPGQKSAAVLS